MCQALFEGLECSSDRQYPCCPGDENLVGWRLRASRVMGRAWGVLRRRLLKVRSDLAPVSWMMTEKVEVSAEL